MKLVKSSAMAVLCLTATLAVAWAGPQEEPPKTDDAQPAVEVTPTGDPVDLKLSFAAGDKHAYEVAMSIDQNLDMGGMQMATAIQINQAFSVEVVAVGEDGVADVKLSYGRISGSMENPMMGAIEFDSDGETTETGNPMMDMVGKAFTVMANQSFEGKLDQRGKLSDVKGFEKLLESMGESLGAMAGQMKDTLSSDGIKQQFEQAFVSLPEGGVRVGETWEDKTEAAGAMNSKVSVTKKSRISKLNDDTVEIAVEGTMELKFGAGDDDGGGDPQMAMMRELLKEAKMSNNAFKGSMVVSRKNGFPISNSNELTMTLEMPNPSGGAAMVIEQTVSTTLKQAAVPAPAEKTEEAK